jgi:hypothetical protein
LDKGNARRRELDWAMDGVNVGQSVLRQALKITSKKRVQAQCTYVQDFTGFESSNLGLRY